MKQEIKCMHKHENCKCDLNKKNCLGIFCRDYEEINEEQTGDNK